MAYDSKAQEFVFGYYAKGWSKERALPEIRKVYAGFSGSTWDEWEKKLDWKLRRAEADRRAREFSDFCRNAAHSLMSELEEVRLKLFEKVKGGKAETQDVYAYTAVVKQMSDIARRHLDGSDPAKVQTEVLAKWTEDLLNDLKEDPDLAKALERHASRVGDAVARATEKHGRVA